MRGLVSRRGCLPSAESGRPVAGFDEVINQSGHVIVGAWCWVAEPLGVNGRDDYRGVLVRSQQRASAVRVGQCESSSASRYLSTGRRR